MSTTPDLSLQSLVERCIDGDLTRRERLSLFETLVQQPAALAEVAEVIAFERLTADLADVVDALPTPATTPEEHARRVARFLARFWTDGAYRDRVRRAPRATLAAAGLPPSAGKTLVVHENSENTLHLVLPPLLDSDRELDDEELDLAVAAGQDPQAGLEQSAPTGWEFLRGWQR